MKADINKYTADAKARRRRGMAGVSITELIIVMVIIAVMSAIAIPSIYNSRRLYKPEDQALKVMDLMREANQLALTRRRTMRLEIDMNDNQLLLIDEDTRTTPAVHRRIKAIPLEAKLDVRVDQKPTDITATNPLTYNDAVYATDAVGHYVGGTKITGHSVWAIRFKSDGSVVNSSDNITSGALYFWTPKNSGSNQARSLKEVRAVTIFGGSGAVRYWKHTGTAFAAYN